MMIKEISARNYFLRAFILTSALGVLLITACTNPEAVDEKDKFPQYEGTDLGLTFGEEGARIKVWSPQAESVLLKVFEDDHPDSQPFREKELAKSDRGTWEAEIGEELIGKYYSLSAKIDGTQRPEVPGPYAKAVGTNGLRGHILNPAEAVPEGWEDDASPPLGEFSDIVIYELHIRDFSIHPESGMEHKGKYLAFTEKGTTTPGDIATGIDHLREMGVTHVHLLPAFDYLSVDESRLDEPQFNWGYDPQNFNVPEGSYSTNPSDGAVRIREFKAMVKALHDAGICVVMDVVYNHTGKVEGLSFDALVPGYYYRYREDGSLSNASGCGNETASEQPMMRKFMIESLKYWVEEYHIDGFRFDLMAVHDIATMNAIEKELRSIRPDIFIYGEGWTADDSPLPENKRALKKYTYRMPGIAAFSDDIRDGLKGSWSREDSRGFVGNVSLLRESVKFGIVGATEHEWIDYDRVNNSNAPWALEPQQCIGYVSCHDNHTLFDKLTIAHPDASEDDIRKMHILAHAIVLTSQGIPFLHAGAEFMRTKGGEENSYKSPDTVNRLDWSRKAQHADVVTACRDLIALRKAHPAFRLGAAHEIRARLKFLPSDTTVIAYHIDAPESDPWSEVFVAFNGGHADKETKLPEGAWRKAWRGSGSVDDSEEISGSVSVPEKGAIIAFKKR
ncbi:MAG: type I pullulanase [Flavobacteriales bacterium]|nr:type I pullulanase [Flavobacteriales bacterium]